MSLFLQRIDSAGDDDSSSQITTPAAASAGIEHSFSRASLTSELATPDTATPSARVSFLRSNLSTSTLNAVPFSLETDLSATVDDLTASQLTNFSQSTATGSSDGRAAEARFVVSLELVRRRSSQLAFSSDMQLVWADQDFQALHNLPPTFAQDGSTWTAKVGVGPGSIKGEEELFFGSGEHH